MNPCQKADLVLSILKGRSLGDAGAQTQLTNTPSGPASLTYVAALHSNACCSSVKSMRVGLLVPRLR